MAHTTGASATTPRDAIFTDRKIGYALGFYAERIVFYNREFTSIDGIAKWRGKYALPDHRVLYLWENEAAKANPTLHDDLVKTYGLPYKAGVLTFFVLHGEPNPDWQPFGAP